MGMGPCDRFKKLRPGFRQHGGTNWHQLRNFLMRVLSSVLADGPNASRMFLHTATTTTLLVSVARDAMVILPGAIAHLGSTVGVAGGDITADEVRNWNGDGATIRLALAQKGGFIKCVENVFLSTLDSGRLESGLHHCVEENFLAGEGSSVEITARTLDSNTKFAVCFESINAALALADEHPGATIEDVLEGPKRPTTRVVLQVDVLTIIMNTVEVGASEYNHVEALSYIKHCVDVGQIVNATKFVVASRRQREQAAEAQRQAAAAASASGASISLVARFNENETVFIMDYREGSVPDPSDLTMAKIISVRMRDDKIGHEYKCHCVGWKSKYDCWVRDADVYLSDGTADDMGNLVTDADNVVAKQLKVELEMAARLPGTLGPDVCEKMRLCRSAHKVLELWLPSQLVIATQARDKVERDEWFAGLSDMQKVFEAFRKKVFRGAVRPTGSGAWFKGVRCPRCEELDLHCVFLAVIAVVGDFCAAQATSLLNMSWENDGVYALSDSGHNLMKLYLALQKAWLIGLGDDGSCWLMNSSKLLQALMEDPVSGRRFATFWKRRFNRCRDRMKWEVFIAAVRDELRATLTAVKGRVTTKIVPESSWASTTIGPQMLKKPIAIVVSDKLPVFVVDAKRSAVDTVICSMPAHRAPVGDTTFKEPTAVVVLGDFLIVGNRGDSDTPLHVGNVTAIIRPRTKVHKRDVEGGDSDDEDEEQRYKAKEHAVVARASVTEWIPLTLDADTPLVKPRYMVAVNVGDADMQPRHQLPGAARVYIVTTKHELFCLHDLTHGDDTENDMRGCTTKIELPATMASALSATQATMGGIAAAKPVNDGSMDVLVVLVVGTVVVMTVDATSHIVSATRQILRNDDLVVGAIAINGEGTHLAVGCKLRKSVYEVEVTVGGDDVQSWGFGAATRIAGAGRPGPRGARGERSGIGDFVLFGDVTALAYWRRTLFVVDARYGSISIITSLEPVRRYFDMLSNFARVPKLHPDHTAVGLEGAVRLMQEGIDYIERLEAEQSIIFGRTTGESREGIMSVAVRKAVRLNARAYADIQELLKREAPACVELVTPAGLVSEHVEHHHNFAREKREMPTVTPNACQRPLTTPSPSRHTSLAQVLTFRRCTPTGPRVRRTAGADCGGVREAPRCQSPLALLHAGGQRDGQAWPIP
jgi:hypothetical protein